MSEEPLNVRCDNFIDECSCRCPYCGDLLNEMKNIDVEGNYTAQLAGVIHKQAGVTMDYFVLKWNGRHMSADEVYEALKLIMCGKVLRRQMLTHDA